MRNEQDFLDSTEGGVVSWQEYVSKPGEEIFRILIERYAIDPGRAVFIDDTLENVETAGRLGFQCINYEDGQDLEAELRKMGILL